MKQLYFGNKQSSITRKYGYSYESSYISGTCNPPLRVSMVIVMKQLYFGNKQSSITRKYGYSYEAAIFREQAIFHYA